jgi:periplasmic protein TonB
MIIGTLSAINYPPNALKESREGAVHYQLSVTKSGNVKSCVVTQTSGHSDLDDAACKYMKKARFTPALDQKGKPVAGTYSNKLAFRIPR